MTINLDSGRLQSLKTKTTVHLLLRMWNIIKICFNMNKTEKDVWFATFCAEAKSRCAHVPTSPCSSKIHTKVLSSVPPHTVLVAE